MRDSEKVKLGALLHDIGKLECWFKRKPLVAHVDYGQSLIEPLFGGEVASIVGRHHSSNSYPIDFQPSNDLERIVSLAERIASGSDNPDEPANSIFSGQIGLSHIFSNGEIVVQQSSTDDISLFLTRFKQYFSSGSREFEEVLEFLKDENSLTPHIPFNAYPPNNDTSLFNHLRLTSALAGLIYAQGFTGIDLSKYKFALISGDVDGVQGYVQMSSILPDLRARSNRVVEATLSAVRILSENTGTDCVIYQGGGGFLALGSLDNDLEDVKEKAESEFFEKTEQQCTITVSFVEANALEFQSTFGAVWERAIRTLRTQKREKPPLTLLDIPENVRLCDVCRSKPATLQMDRLINIDAAVRPEMICNQCQKLRDQGRIGVSINEVVRDQESKSIGVIRFDGDDLGACLAGTRLNRDFGKVQTCSRLSSLSELIHQVSGIEVRKVVEHEGKGLLVLSGGDDALAIVPGESALNTAYQMEVTFSNRCANYLTASAGVAICSYRFPIYSALEASETLLEECKLNGKGALAFDFIDNVIPRRSDKSVVTHKWSVVKELLYWIEYLESRKLSAGQLRAIVQASRSGFFSARAQIQYQMGRGEIPWEQGNKLLKANDSSLLSTAFSAMSYFRREDSEAVA